MNPLDATYTITVPMTPGKGWDGFVNAITVDQVRERQRATRQRRYSPFPALRCWKRGGHMSGTPGDVLRVFDHRGTERVTLWQVDDERQITKQRRHAAEYGQGVPSFLGGVRLAPLPDLKYVPEPSPTHAGPITWPFPAAFGQQARKEPGFNRDEWVARVLKDVTRAMARKAFDRLAAMTLGPTHTATGGPVAPQNIVREKEGEEFFVGGAANPLAELRAAHIRVSESRDVLTSMASRQVKEPFGAGGIVGAVGTYTFNAGVPWAGEVAGAQRGHEAQSRFDFLVEKYEKSLRFAESKGRTDEVEKYKELLRTLEEFKSKGGNCAC